MHTNPRDELQYKMKKKPYLVWYRNILVSLIDWVGVRCAMYEKFGTQRE